MIKKITLVGSGNVATILGTALFNCGYSINGILPFGVAFTYVDDKKINI